MIDFYNAFISYKHGPLDNKVAAHIQTQLEHFHIPKKIQVKSGKKRIQRIFRDKEELPITSDLSDTIADALEKSDFLIVICSSATKQSVWVKREIQLFLKHHSRDHILTVLSEGEPQDVLPEELLQEEVTVRQPDGTMRTFLREKEPLCCDYRQSFRKADKEELPRLAAALIGCSYDELMNRRRAYQMQRITILGVTLTALALGFSGYMIRNNKKLEKSYNDTLRNQSIYLANESEKLLAQEQRIEAIHLALAALPSDGEDRPVTSEALRALTDSTLAYKPLSGTSIQTVWNYRVLSNIEKMVLSPERKALACLDDSGTVTVWDVETHAVLMEKAFARHTIFSISFTDDDHILIVTGKEILLYDTGSSKKVWNYDCPNSFEFMDPIYVKERDSFYIVMTSDTILHMSCEDGTVLDKHDVTDSYSYNSMSLGNTFCLSPDETKLTFSYNDADSCLVTVFDLTDDSIKSLPISMPNVRNMIWADNDMVIVCGYDLFSGNNTLYTDTKVMAPNENIIVCLDFAEMKEVWSTDFVFSHFVKENGFLLLGEGEEVAFFCGNLLSIFDTSTGEVLHSYDVNYPLVHINDNDGDGVPMFITADGGLGSPVVALGPNTSSVTDEFVDNIQQVIVGGGVYVLQDSSKQILFYDVYVSDDEWEEIDEDVVLHQIGYNYYLDDQYLVVNCLMGTTPCVTAYDASETELLFKIDLDDGYGSQIKILGVWEDELLIAGQKDYSTTYLIRIDIEDGEILEEKAISNALESLGCLISYADGYITYIYEDEKVNGERLRVLDLETGKEEKYVLPFDSYLARFAPQYYPQAEVIYFADKNEGDYIVDTSEHDEYKVKLPKDWDGTTLISPDEKGERWVIGDSSHVFVLDREGETLLEIQSNGLSAIGATFAKFGKAAEQLIVVYDDGSMIRYDAASGAFLGKSEVETYPSARMAAKLRFSSDRKTLFIQTGTITDVVDTETWVEVAVVWNSLGYYEPGDIFFAFSYTNTKDYHIGYFRHYTLSDLIDKAKGILGGAELSEELKSQYGIS